MRFRTLVAPVLGLIAIVVAAFLLLQNRELLESPFRLGSRDAGPGWSVPLWSVVLSMFLAGFLPPSAGLFARNLRRDLHERQARRSNRDAVSLGQTLQRAEDFLSDSQLGKAAEQLEIYLAERPDDFLGQLRYGEVLRLLGRPNDALEVHRRASEAYPRSLSLLYQLIDDYEACRKPEVAAEIRNRILRDFPDRGVRVRRQERQMAVSGLDWTSANQSQDEIDALFSGSRDESAPHRDPSLRRGLDYQRGVHLLEMDRPDDAAEVFRGLLAAEPCFVPARIMLGEAFLLAEDEGAALAEWRRGFDRTGSAVFLQRIEDYFLDIEEPIRAIETLRGLIAASPKSVIARFFLGRLYYRLEMLEDAEKALQKISMEIKASPTYHFLMGRIRERRGQKVLAGESFRRCAQQMGLREKAYQCRSCHDRFPDWRDWCGTCQIWDSIELAVEAEGLEREEVGVRTVPTWAAVDSRFPANHPEASVPAPDRTREGDVKP